MPTLLPDKLRLAEVDDLQANHDFVEENQDAEKQEQDTVCNYLKAKATEHSFIIFVVIAILLAFCYPRGASYLRPDITAGYIAVILIFLVTGISLKTEELMKSVAYVKFNTAVQFFNLGLLPISIYGISRLLVFWGLNRDLANGMVICAALPMSINMVVVLTTSAGGNEAAALFNAVFGNLLGVFISPIWILILLHANSEIGFFEVILKLVYRVFIPVIIGQFIHMYSNRIKNYFKKHKKMIKSFQEKAMAFIVYCVFCKTFEKGTEASIFEILLMAFIQILLLLFTMKMAWLYIFMLFPHPSQRRLCIMGFYGCHHKTVAMGIPLLNAIFDGDSRLGMYTLPLLIWHPSQLLIGSFLTSKISDWADRKDEKDENDESSQNDQMHSENTFETL